MRFCFTASSTSSLIMSLGFGLIGSLTSSLTFVHSGTVCESFEYGNRRTCGPRTADGVQRTAYSGRRTADRVQRTADEFFSFIFIPDSDSTFS
ncbi:unnamed protein product [Nesidiocoris tenuis]|uniref:Uncharacterized protein n=1 Tax=Nesidiocoris tenuis TaxID=355587 RepID=A0A6H5HRD0_9HEMI|nr:unnamed protein product [Nesidiocoris tenuis]